MPNLFDSIKAASLIADEVIVAFSGGKDSVVTLDLCCKHFKKVHAFFMYQIPNLSFQNEIIGWAERKYSTEVLMIPHFEVSNFFRYGSFSLPDANVRIVSITDIYSYVREVFSCSWIAAGERIADSIVRRAMIKRSSSIDLKRNRFYPIANWNKKEIVSYIERNKLRTSPESKYLGHSFRSLMPEDMLKIKDVYPGDYAKIIKFYPFAESSAMKAAL